eukprot:10488925-Karenia_brevis.AAC.1
MAATGDVTAVAVETADAQQALLLRPRPLAAGPGQDVPPCTHSMHTSNIRICTVNITNTSKKCIIWLSELPYDIILVQEHHKLHNAQRTFLHITIGKALLCCVFPSNQNPH